MKQLHLICNAHLDVYKRQDLDQIMCFGTPQEVAESVRKTILAANKNGGFILSTCNTMIDSIPTENVWAMIKASENILK